MDDSIGQVTIIANPAAGRGRARAAAMMAEELLREGGRSVDVCLTTGAGHASALAAQRGPGSDLIVVVGGDGTVSEVLAGLRQIPEPRPPIAIVPAGAGNDFAAALGISAKAAVAVTQLPGGRPRAVDLALLTPGDIPVASVVGCGFDARVARRLAGRRLLTGRARYVGGVLAEVLVLRSMPARLEVDDQTLEGDFLLIAIANSPAYGGGMRIAPQADLTDGLLDVIAIERVGRVRFLRHFPLVFAGRHLDLPEVRALRGTQVRIEPPAPEPILLDGDVRAETPIEVRVEPRAGLFWVPEQ